MCTSPQCSHSNKPSSEPQPKPDHVVLILDDDHSVLVGLERLLASHGYHVRSFADANDLISAGKPKLPACLILDNQLACGVMGSDVHDELQTLGWNLPTIFLTAHWNVRSVVSAMRAGAEGFITKPFDPEELLQAVAGALAQARKARKMSRAEKDAKQRASTLTSREREVVQWVISGLMNKEIAEKMGLALVTVKVHRARAMRKLDAGNPVELAIIAALAEIKP